MLTADSSTSFSLAITASEQSELAATQATQSNALSSGDGKRSQIYKHIEYLFSLFVFPILTLHQI